VKIKIHSWNVKSGDTTKLISIPKWNFHWQGFYEYQKLIHIQNGSTFWAEATYDNTTNNPYNPSNPPQDVEAGEHTTDEMMIVFFAYTGYEPGDENIILDSTLNTSVPTVDIPNDFSMHVFPNPVSDEMNVGLDLKKSENVTFMLYNSSGAAVKEWNKTLSLGAQAHSFLLDGLSSGMYVLKASSKDGNAMVKVMKEE